LAVCFEKRNRKRIGKKLTTIKTRKIINISDSGIPRSVFPELKAERNVPAITPITINKPRKMKQTIARNMVHFLVIFRFFSVSCSISIFLFSRNVPMIIE
jgi:hypothetical protein